MKYKQQILKLLTIVLLLPVFANGQDYHPFPEENAFWTVVEFDQQIWEWETYIYTVKGDTAINDKPYKKIYRLNDIPNSKDTLWTLHNFMRQDTINKKIWFIRHYQGETTEKLGYDFDVEIGDTVYLPAFDYANIGDSIFEVIDPGDDSTKLRNDEYRKNYFYSSIDPFSDFSPFIIEGVGTQRTAFPNLLFYDPFHQSELICHIVNGEYLYGPSPLPNECDFTVNIGEEPVEINISIQPNPCKNNLLIIFFDNRNEHIEIQLCNIFGLVLIDQGLDANITSYKMNTSNIPNGIYLLQLNSNSINYSTKIIVNH